MKRIKIKTLSKNYDVLINSGNFSNLKKELLLRNFSKRIYLLIDKNVDRHWGTAIRKLIGSFSEKLYIHIFNPEEKRKNINSLTKIYSELTANGFGRDTVLISVGGGITGDLGGFAASTFMRGVQLVQIPTTILASVDSSIGGKTGVNFFSYKNLIGTFYQPDLVFIQPAIFSTLPQTEIKCGAGEIIKYAVLSGNDFFSFVYKNFDRLLNLDTRILNKILENCINIKAKIVETDEREKELRKVLNLGHTFAHAFETVSNFKLKHGEAVAVGITAAAILSEKLKIIEPKSFLKIVSLSSKMKVNSRLLKVKPDRMIKALQMDKKKQSGKVEFVLPIGIGEIALGIAAPMDKVISSINESISLFQK